MRIFLKSGEIFLFSLLAEVISLINNKFAPKTDNISATTIIAKKPNSKTIQ